MKPFLFISVFALVFLVTSCTPPPDFPDEPVIEFVSLTRNVLVQDRTGQADSTTMTISFTDGDGDLSFGEESNIFLRDLRTTAEAGAFTIPKIPEQGAVNGIKGTISFRVLTTCCVYPPDLGLINCSPSGGLFPEDTLRYEIYIVDQAGNESNRIETAPIFLQCQ